MKCLLSAAVVFFGAFLKMPSLSSAEPAVVAVVFDGSGKGTMMVADPAAIGKKALAIDVNDISGTHRLKSTAPRLEAGRYRMTLYARLFSTASDDFTRLRLDWTIGDEKNARRKDQFMWTQFDSSPSRYTPLTMELTLATPMTPVFDLGWQQVTTGPLDRVRPIRKVEPPTTPKGTDPSSTTPKKMSGGIDILDDIDSQKAASLAAVGFPALLIDRVTIEPISRTQWVEAVLPKFVHVYPGQANPVEVSVRNLENRAVPATISLEVRAGLDETLHTATKQVSLPAAGSATCKFDWAGSNREFGHEVRATLTVGGKVVHAASDYYSVSLPIWKTALQANGFLDWYGREKNLLEHVTRNRALYLNVEEAFSWQPSSWTDLTPKTEHWWSGQGDAHNNATGLKLWLDASHEHGIKMITYLWSSASGPERFGVGARGRPSLSPTGKSVWRPNFWMSKICVSSRLRKRTRGYGGCVAASGTTWASIAACSAPSTKASPRPWPRPSALAGMAPASIRRQPGAPWAPRTCMPSLRI